MAIKLSKENETRLIQSIQRYFRENLEEEIGDLKALLMLEFCLKEIGPTIYNKTILDAQTYMQDRVTDLDGCCFELEFDYWKKH